MKSSTEVNYQQRILRVLNYINKHLDDDLSLEQLASLAHFSAYHFHRIFSQVVGESLKEYIRRRKTQRAIMQLNLKEMSITEIAFNAGFQSTEAFSRHIKKQFGASPRDIRQGKQKILHDLDQIVGDFPPVDIQLITRDDTDVAYLLHIGPYEQALKAWEQMANLVGLATLIANNTDCYGIPYDHPLITPADKCHYAACITWRDEYATIKQLHRMTLPGGRYAKIHHIGPPENIELSYQRFAHSAISLDTPLEFADAPSFMQYDLTSITTPERFSAEIYFPLA